ncbi:MAG TPA: transglutaminase-like cysteine peptidase [Pseudolabrys sp.]|nr:transglutaminase-like cysteine peptidase [Pseudolabrys sp.]
MGWRFENVLRSGGAVVIGVAVALAANSGKAATAPLQHFPSAPAAAHASYIPVGATTSAPIGWIEFCIEYKPECNTSPSAPRDVVLTTKAWADMVKVNLWVNETIKPMTDMEHWGVIERWSYPSDGYGDCEDYVLLKRRMLMKAGWPREALLITVVRDKKGDGHAVLTVRTDRGEYILDNQTDQIRAWNNTGYRFVKRQSQSDPNVWVTIGTPRSAPPIVSAR